MSKNTVDMWNGRPFIKKAYFADAFFSDCDCVYRGNIYDDGGHIIGDYSSSDSVWIEENFKISF